MKKLFPIIFAILALVSLIGCTQPTDKSGFRVYNSAWEDVTPTVVKAASLDGARATTEYQTLDEYVDGYNATHTDDQLTVEAGEVPIEEAPDAEAYVVNASTLAQYWTTTVKRSDLESQREQWRATLEVWPNPDGSGAFVPVTLYVDNIPPEPPVIIPVGPKLYVSLYNQTAKLYYYAETYELESSARSRYNLLTYAVEANNADPTLMGAGVWAAYWGSVPFPEAYPDYSPGTLP